MQLMREPPMVGYSVTEREMFSMLAGEKSTSSNDLVERWYADGRRARPFDARQTVNAIINRLNDKMEANGEPFIIERVPPRPGPRPSNLRVVRRRRS